MLTPMDPGAELLKRVERAHALFDKAVTPHQTRDFNAAEKRCQAALFEFRPLSRTQDETIDPQFSGAYAALGKLFVTLEEPKPAIFEVERAIELNQADALSIYNLGLAFHLDQRYEDALHCFERAITI